MPFTVYVTTGFMDREVRVWWYGLERLLAEGGLSNYELCFRHKDGSLVWVLANIVLHEEPSGPADNSRSERGVSVRCGRTPPYKQ